MDDLSTGLVDRAKSRVGTMLREKWRLDRLLGIGGMAAVYAATHRNGSRGAIKMLHPELSIDAEVKRRFLREGYVANAVDHPGTVKVLDDDATDDGSVFIVMELLEGETLEALSERRGGRIPAGELLPLVDQLLDVLAVAHARGVVHRDIKPENVFLTVNGVVKLLDFGIARLRRHQGSVATVTGSTFGTPAFMPPEQALGRTEEVEARSDLWSVGATLFTLLAGRAVHVTQTLNEQLVAHAAMRAPSLAVAAPWAPPALIALVDRAIAYDKADRWQTATAMQQALRAVLATGLQAPAAAQFAPTVPMPVMGGAGMPLTSPPNAPVQAVSMPARLAPVAPSVTSVTSVTATGTPSLSAGPQHGRVLFGAGAGALVVLLGVIAVSLSLRGPPATAATHVPTPEPTTASLPAPAVPSAALSVEVAPPAPVRPAPSASVTAAPSASVTAAPSASVTAAPSAPAVAAATPAVPRPRPSASAVAKPSKSGDWLDRQH